MIVRRVVNHLFSFFNAKDRTSEIKTNEYPHVYLPQQIADDTAKLLISYGTEGAAHEGIVYWAGMTCAKQWLVTTIVAPNASTTSGSYKTDAISNALMINRVNQMNLRLLAQVHSHPGAWVGHSDGDNIGAFMPYDGFYSVVVPLYARHGILPLTKCGFHRFEQGRFVEFNRKQIAASFSVLPTSIDLRNSP